MAGRRSPGAAHGLVVRGPGASRLAPPARQRRCRRFARRCGASQAPPATRDRGANRVAAPHAGSAAGCRACAAPAQRLRAGKGQPDIAGDADRCGRRALIGQRGRDAVRHQQPRGFGPGVGQRPAPRQGDRCQQCQTDGELGDEVARDGVGDLRHAELVEHPQLKQRLGGQRQCHGGHQQRRLPPQVTQQPSVTFDRYRRQHESTVLPRQPGCQRAAVGDGRGRCADETASSRCEHGLSATNPAAPLTGTPPGVRRPQKPFRRSGGH